MERNKCDSVETLIAAFGLVDFDTDYDYKKERYRKI